MYIVLLHLSLLILLVVTMLGISFVLFSYEILYEPNLRCFDIKVVERVASRELHSAVAIVRPPGHHAEQDKAMGFCLFNNVAIAARYLLDERVGNITPTINF